jgi:uncharacterized membrane protein
LSVAPIARTGLIAKGIVYCLLGILAFMSAFEIGGHSNKEADKKGVFQMVEGAGGKLLLAVLTAGLLCYTIWRFVHAFNLRKTEKDKKKIAGKMVRYIFSGLVYLSVAAYAIKKLFGNANNNGDSTHDTASQLMQKPFGVWAVGILALIMLGTGVYQAYYGLSEKFKKHVEGMNLHSAASKTLLLAGKIGYLARGMVWLIVAWLLMKAAMHANSDEAGDTSKAFEFLEKASYGSYLLGALGLGVICYGLFNFVRARYEQF